MLVMVTMATVTARTFRYENRRSWLAVLDVRPSLIQLTSLRSKLMGTIIDDRRIAAMQPYMDKYTVNAQPSRSLPRVLVLWIAAESAHIRCLLFCSA